jgi:hypothetical protein
MTASLLEEYTVGRPAPKSLAFNAFRGEALAACRPQTHRVSFLSRQTGVSMRKRLLVTVTLASAVSAAAYTAGTAPNQPDIPRTWDDQEIARHEVPLADPTSSPKHVSSEYYYRMPVRPIYKSYPVYAPGREPVGYLDRLRQEEPVVVWDEKQAPPHGSDADWVRAGEIVFDAPITTEVNISVEDVRNPEWLEATKTPVAADGSLPWFQYIIRTKGKVELGNNSCGFCHIRVMPDGRTIKGAQGNLPVQRAVAFRWKANAAAAPDKQQYLEQLRTRLKSLHAAPHLRPDPEDRIDAMTTEEIISVFEAVPPGTSPRQRGNTFLSIQVPDLIGVKERRYLDRTGLERHRSIADLMRYAAMNQGGDSLASYAGFVPADAPRFAQPPPPERVSRYSDEQLYALALYIYSLQPPPNPNRFDGVAQKGQDVFEREGCGDCHAPPLYTNNKLTPAVGFRIPPEHLTAFDIMRRSVGTDPELTMRTRRGTGYYKVPSLKGVWYRSMFGHNGWSATLEDWFDHRRVRDDYVPTGFKPFDRATFPVKGHRFGLDLDETERRALIAFLRTL